MNSFHLITTVGVSAMYCAGLRHILDKRIFQIGEHLDGIERALQPQPGAQSPSAILINVARRPLPNASVIARLRERFPEARLVLVEEVCSGERIQEAIEVDLDGYLLETMRALAFSKALELILIGERVFPVLQLKPALRREREAADPSFAELSESQMRVVALLAHAFPNKVIARELGISESTVKVHVKAILRKTGARNRTDVALLARGFDEAASSRAAEIAIPRTALGAEAETEAARKVRVLELRREAPVPEVGRGRQPSAMSR